MKSRGPGLAAQRSRALRALRSGAEARPAQVSARGSEGSRVSGLGRESAGSHLDASSNKVSFRGDERGGWWLVGNSGL